MTVAGARTQRLTPDEIRSTLAGSSLEQATSGLLLPPSSERWPQEWLDMIDGELKRAGVLIPLLERSHGLNVLLTQRSAELKMHAGQVSFPGGRVEDHDSDVEATALRETHEEVGIEPDQVSVAGYLDTMPTITGYAVTPVVGLVSGDPLLVIDRSEVEYAFEVPLDYLLDAGNDVPVEREVFGQKFVLTEFHWEGERIWGATAYMILAFRKRLLKQR